MRKHTCTALMVVVLAMVMAACGDDDEAAIEQRAREAEQRARETATTVARGVEGVTRLKANLTGAAEVPGPGDPDGTGTAAVNIDATKGQLCYEVAVQKIDRPTGMHIHEGATGKSGDIRVPLTPPTASDTTTTGCVDVDRTLMGRISAQPGEFYVNVHSDRYPQGAVRGQLTQ